MPNVRELSESYCVSRSTMTRHIKKCFNGDAPKRGKMIQLDASQMQVFADYMGKQEKLVPHHDASKDKIMTGHDASSEVIEVARLRERIEGLERENVLLRERLAVSDSALIREQMAVRGFWSKLGNKLLGGGKSND